MASSQNCISLAGYILKLWKVQHFFRMFLYKNVNFIPADRDRELFHSTYISPLQFSIKFIIYYTFSRLGLIVNNYYDGWKIHAIRLILRPYTRNVERTIDRSKWRHNKCSGGVAISESTEPLQTTCEGW